MTEENAIKAIRNGMVAATISLLVTTAVLVFVMTRNNSTGSFSYLNDPINLIDLVIIVTCIFGLYKRWRAAGIVLIALLILGGVNMYYETGRVSGLPLKVIFLYMYYQATVACFTLHKMNADGVKTKRSIWRKILIGSGLFISFIIVLFLSIGALAMLEIIPSAEVRTGSLMKPRHKLGLSERGIIQNTDVIQQYYYNGFLSVYAGGVILTNDTLIVYAELENGRFNIQSVAVRDVGEILQQREGNYIDESVWSVESKAQNKFLIFALSAEDGGDIEFISALESLAEK
jgi:hypothetical protein